MVGPAWQPERLRGPWFHDVAPLVARLAAAPRWPSIADLDGALRDGLARAGVRLVPAAPARRRGAVIDPASLYELRIADAGEIPSRAENLHDLLNALCWAAFPAGKRALTLRLADLQRARLAPGATRLPGRRTPDHDRLALLDEGGVVVASRRRLTHDPDAIAAAIAAGDASAHVLGHALLEHAARGAAGVRAAVLLVDGAPGAGVDAALAAAVAAPLALGGPGLEVDPRWFPRR